MTFSTKRDQPVPKIEPKVLPLDVVNAQVEAAEKVQDKFDVDPELKDLYYDSFSLLLDEIAKNTKIQEKESDSPVALPWEIK